MKTRFAPSPTGFLHIGGARTALYNYLRAKAEGGEFVLRIEDTDRTRFVEGSEEDILASLEWMGIQVDNADSVPRQSERSALYEEHVERLIDQGHAYPCFCTPERLDQMRQDQLASKRPPMYDRTCSRLDPEVVAQRIADGEDYVIRLKIDREKEYVLQDEIRGEVVFAGETIDDQVLIKSDGMPTYHLASVVDDHDMNITHVMRGEEWLPSTPKHIALYEYFGWEAPQFAHIPLLLGKDGSKLSKRQGDVAFHQFIEKGYLSSALVNFISLLGWNPGDEREMFTLEDLVATFDVARIHKSGAVFDYDKLDWMNGKYIRDLELDELIVLVRSRLEEAEIEITSDEVLHRAVEELQDRYVTLSEVPELMDYFFSDPDYENELLSFKTQPIDAALASLELAHKRLQLEEHWNRDHLKDVLVDLAKENGIGNGEMLWPIRVALCGKDKSPGAFELLEVFGKEESLRRLSLAIEKG